MSNPSGTPAASAHPLHSYLQADHLGPWGNYLQQVDRVTPYPVHYTHLTLPTISSVYT